MHLDKYPTKPWLSEKEKKIVAKIPPPLNLNSWNLFAMFSKYIYFFNVH